MQEFECKQLLWLVVSDALVGKWASFTEEARVQSKVLEYVGHCCAIGAQSNCGPS